MDIHKLKASQVFGVPYDDVTKEQRECVAELSRKQQVIDRVRSRLRQEIQLSKNFPDSEVLTGRNILASEILLMLGGDESNG